MTITGDMTIKKAKQLWAKHFVQVKANIEQPKKTHTATVQMKKGGSYKYKYADLADVDKAVMDACKKVTDNDGKVVFGYYFDIDNGEEGVSVQTILVDASGYEKATNKVWFKNFNVGKAQDTAILISYAKRYSLCGAFGIAADDDDDAQHLQQPTQTRDVNDVGLDVIWNAYIKDHNEKAKKWLLGSHDAVTAKKINQKLMNFKNETQEAKKQEETKPPKASDPHKDEKVDTQVTDQQQELFNDIFSE
ncbi:hypothetical protein EFS28_08580 [Lactobacillus acidophilus]|uniref:ERF family protein n=1 Tax=Lactobacillus acidophilus TaxID=1579 RepID=UPI0021A65EB3|nr:ERF family protein [Lactobacillus acidophilus]MCT3601562.1 hypothetical protein [Lactobacillus acidophilus]MCT3624259.1 hypothetical protein [Lactobacillus acidophilus]